MLRFITTLSALGLALFLGGCHGMPHMSPHYGNALRANNDQMILDPSAGTAAAHEGLDPRSAEHALDNYSKGQKAQEHRRPKANGGGGIDIEIGDVAN